MLLCCYRTGRNTICPAAFFRPKKRKEKLLTKRVFDILTTCNSKEECIHFRHIRNSKFFETTYDEWNEWNQEKYVVLPNKIFDIYVATKKLKIFLYVKYWLFSIPVTSTCLKMKLRN